MVHLNWLITSDDFFQLVAVQAFDTKHQPMF